MSDERPLIDPHSLTSCPKCGSAVEHGYGLAGGGYGSYAWCDAGECDFFLKAQECPKCEGVIDADCTCEREDDDE